MKRLIPILALLLVFASCNLRGLDTLEKDVKREIQNEISNGQVEDVRLSHIRGNDYEGVVVISENGKSGMYDLFVRLTGNGEFYWEILDYYPANDYQESDNNHQSSSTNSDSNQGEEFGSTRRFKRHGSRRIQRVL